MKEFADETLREDLRSALLILGGAVASASRTCIVLSAALAAEVLQLEQE